MEISFDEIKRLKLLTGVGVTEAKKALEDVGGDFDKACEAMRTKGMARAEKKGDREARQGLVDSYLHSGRIGVIVEVNCETDFVARTDDFKAFVHDVAMQIAASAPEFLTPDDVPKEVVEKEQAIEAKILEEQGKDKVVIDKILGGKMAKFYEKVCLSKQLFIKNPEITIEDYTKEMIAKLGENIVIRNMSRIELGDR